MLLALWLPSLLVRWCEMRPAAALTSRLTSRAAGGSLITCNGPSFASILHSPTSPPPVPPPRPLPLLPWSSDRLCDRQQNDQSVSHTHAAPHWLITHHSLTRAVCRHDLSLFSWSYAHLHIKRCVVQFSCTAPSWSTSRVLTDASTHAVSLVNTYIYYRHVNTFNVTFLVCIIDFSSSSVSQ